MIATLKFAAGIIDAKFCREPFGAEPPAAFPVTIHVRLGMGIFVRPFFQFASQSLSRIVSDFPTTTTILPS
jgi:hypothetical protein